MFVSRIQFGIALLLVTPSLSYAIKLEPSHLEAQAADNRIQSLRTTTPENQFHWENDNEQLPSIWDTWKYDWDMTELVSAQTQSMYYGFGVWQPQTLEAAQDKLDVAEWVKSHGLKFSFSAKSESTNTRYRIDLRWHERTDTEWLLQMQVPLK